jgi:hypothetical protein
MHPSGAGVGRSPHPPRIPPLPSRPVRRAHTGPGHRGTADTIGGRPPDHYGEPCGCQHAFRGVAEVGVTTSSPLVSTQAGSAGLADQASRHGADTRTAPRTPAVPEHRGARPRRGYRTDTATVQQAPAGQRRGGSCPRRTAVGRRPHRRAGHGGRRSFRRRRPTDLQATHDLRDLAGARGQLERALAVGEAALGSDHP